MLTAVEVKVGAAVWLLIGVGHPKKHRLVTHEVGVPVTALYLLHGLLPLRSPSLETDLSRRVWLPVTQWH